MRPQRVLDPKLPKRGCLGQPCPLQGTLAWDRVSPPRWTVFFEKHAASVSVTGHWTEDRDCWAGSRVKVRVRSMTRSNHDPQTRVTTNQASRFDGQPARPWPALWCILIFLTGGSPSCPWWLSRKDWPKMTRAVTSLSSDQISQPFPPWSQPPTTGGQEDKCSAGNPAGNLGCLVQFSRASHARMGWPETLSERIPGRGDSGSWSSYTAHTRFHSLLKIQECFW